MKIIHTSDIHLDSRIDTLPTEKAKIRRGEIVRTFELLCEYADKNAVDAVIIAGDAFDTSRVTAKTLGRFFHAIKECKNTEFLYLAGNHDEDTVLSAEADDFPSNFKTFGDEWKTYSFGKVKISGITLDKANSKYVYDGLKLAADDINIVCMHGQVLGYKSDDIAETVSIPLLRGKNVDYLALGHIHSFSANVIDERGKYAYCGCLNGRGFDETGEKGFVLINIEDGKINADFVPFCDRVFHTVEYAVDGASDFYEFCNGVIADLKKTCAAEDLIKVVLKGERTPDFLVDTDALATKLNDSFFFGKVYDRTLLKVSADDYAEDKSVRGEFVRSVLASDLSEEDKTAVITKGLAALKGEL